MNRFWVSSLALAVLLAVGGRALADDKKLPAFGTLDIMSVEAAQAKSLAWLKEVGKSDAAALQQAEAIWKRTDRTVLDRVADTLALGEPAAAKLLAESRDVNTPAPTKVPELLKDTKHSQFFRTNLGLAYARNLSNRRIFEEALAVLKTFHPEHVVDPSGYLFHRAVAEHAMLQKAEAKRSIERLREDVQTSPQRYLVVAALMDLDMITWKDKDLGAIARKMENIERRLDLARGGPETQRQQKEVIARLDELIKELENKAKKKPGDGKGDPNGGA